VPTFFILLTDVFHITLNLFILYNPIQKSNKCFHALRYCRITMKKSPKKDSPSKEKRSNGGTSSASGTMGWNPDSVKDGQEVMCETRRKMEAAGLGLDRGLTKLDQLLEATKPISCIKGKDADGGTVDFVDTPDNQAQCKALDMLLSLGDYYPTKKFKGEVNHSGSIMAAVAKHMSGEK